MKSGVLTLFRDDGSVVTVGYDFLVGLPVPQIQLVPPCWVELTEDETDGLWLEVLQREGEQE